MSGRLYVNKATFDYVSNIPFQVIDSPVVYYRDETDRAVIGAVPVVEPFQFIQEGKNPLLAFRVTAYAIFLRDPCHLKVCIIF